MFPWNSQAILKIIVDFVDDFSKLVHTTNLQGFPLIRRPVTGSRPSYMVSGTRDNPLPSYLGRGNV